MDTLQFLNKMYEYAERGFTQVFALPSTAASAVPVTDFAQVPAIVSSYAGQDIYFSPGITAAPINKKLSADDIIGIPGLWVDIDMYHPQAHAKQNLPMDVAEAMSILPDQLQPSIIVFSGYGLHVWYLFRECWYFDTPEEKQHAQELLTRLQGHIRRNADAKGWHIDSVQDLCRVMRLPGTLNVKLPAAPIMSQVIESSEDRYNPSEIDELLPELEYIVAPTRQRKTAFERRSTDGPSEHMLKNCMFMQHVQLNAKTLSYGEWLAALTNLVRATDGVEVAHSISSMDSERYKTSDTDKKIDECLQAMSPQTCSYIQTAVGFQGCPSGGCGIQAPCGWSLGKLPQAKSTIRSITVPTPETVYSPDIIGALAIVQRDAPMDYDIFMQKCKGQVNINTLKSELKKQRAADAGFTVYDGGSDNANDTAEIANDGQQSVNGHWLADTVPDIPLNLELPKKSRTQTWYFRQNGVSLLRVTNNGESFSEVSYAPVLITERIYNIDTCQEKAKVTFRTSRHGWRSVVLPKSVIFDGKRIMCLADSGLTMNGDMARNLSKWLSALEAANVNIIPEKTGVSKIGWRNEEKEFILPGMTSEYVLDAGTMESEGVLSAMKTAGDFGEWIEAMRYLRTRPKARFMLAASFAAPLLKIVGQRTFLVHNWGTTADGKTAVLQAAMSVWGKPDELYRTFDNTKASLEKTAELFTDLPLGINEYEVLNDRRKGEVDQIIYMIGEGKGRGRANRDGSLQKAASWRTIAIMNGESPITNSSSRGGIITRVIELHGGPLKDDQGFASDLYRILSRNYGHAGRWFIHKLLEADHENLRDQWNKTREALRQVFPGKLDAHIDAISCIVLADYLASQWIFGSDQDAAGAEAINMGSAILGELVVKSEADESQRAWDWLQDWIAANSMRIQKDHSKDPVGIVLGYADYQHVYLIRTELSNAMKEEGFSPEKIYRQWADEGRIPVTTRKDGRKDYGIKGNRIGGAQPWLICIEYAQ